MSIFYVIFILLTAYFSYRYDRIEEYDSHKQHRYWLMCGYLVCLTGFSYGLGGDKFVYMREFEAYPESLEEAADFIWIQFMLNGQMPLWTLVNAFAKVVFNSFYAVQLIQGAVVNIAVCYVISKYTHRYFLFMIVYFLSLQYFIFNTEIMREGFALAFVLVGMHGWLSGKKWLFFVTLPIGLLFHVSAAIALLFPLAFFKVSWKTLFFAFFISFAIWLFSDIILGKVMVSVLGGMGALVQKVLFYSIQASTIFGFLRSAITYLIFPFIIMYTVMQNETDSVRRKCMERMIAFMVLLGIVASAFAGLVRFYNYARFFYLALMAEFIYTLFWQKKLFFVRSFTLMGTIFLILLQYFKSYETTRAHFYDFYYPYTCILNETKDVYIRELTHQESAAIKETDNNVRNIE